MKKFKRKATFTMEMVLAEGESIFPVTAKSLRNLADFFDDFDEAPIREFEQKIWDDPVNFHWKAEDPIEIEPDIPVDDPIGIGDGTGMDPAIEGVPAADGGKY